MPKRRFDNKKVEIGGLIYTIKYKKFKDLKHVIIKAEICTKTRTIWLRDDMTPSEELQALLHEIIHGVLDAMLPPHVLVDSEPIEELLVEPFSRILISALRSVGLLRE